MEKGMKKSTLIVVIMAIITAVAVIVAIVAGLHFAKMGVTDATDATDATKEEETNHIMNATVYGAWTQDVCNDMSYGLSQSYDMASETKWTPQAYVTYIGTPGVVYLLDGYYDLDTWYVQVDEDVAFFQLYVSEDGENYTLITETTKDNRFDVYDDNHLCTLNNLNAKNVAYVKMLFTGTASGGTNVNLHEVSFEGTYLEVGPTTIPEWVEPNIMPETLIESHQVIGTWESSLAEDGSYGPGKSYDENAYSKWNPKATKNYEGDPGIVYTLKKATDIRSIQILLGSEEHYFDIFVSKDGETYTQIASIVSGNAGRVYQEGDDNFYICNLDGLQLDDIKYVKLTFTGRKGSSPWANFYEIIISET